MSTLLLDFNGTLFFDTGFHMEAWSKIYKELYPDSSEMPGTNFFCGSCNDDIIRAMAPYLTKEERQAVSEHKEKLYREICRQQPGGVHLTPGAEDLLQYAKEHGISYGLASASIRANVDFYFEMFHLEHWFDRNSVVYDDGSYADKGQMHLEAARRLGSAFSDCIVVEDSVHAITHAKENGAGMIIAIGEEEKYPELIRIGANHCIRDFTEFDYGWLTN